MAVGEGGQQIGGGGGTVARQLARGATQGVVIDLETDHRRG